MESKKRVFIVHGWGGDPSEKWFVWLKENLQKLDYDANVLSMPDTYNPTIEKRVDSLKESVGFVDEDTYFVGHSIGCQTILRFLETLDTDIKIGGIVFVAGWFDLMGLSHEDMDIAKPWIQTPINLFKVKSHVDNVLAIFSDNDPYVNLENEKIFGEELGVDTIIESQKGHYISSDDEIDSIPVILERFNNQK